MTFGTAGSRCVVDAQGTFEPTEDGSAITENAPATCDDAAAHRPPSFGGPLTESDYATLAASWITREIADAAMLRRVDEYEGREIVGQKRKRDCSGILIGYYWPGEISAFNHRIRRDNPEWIAGKDGDPSQSGSTLLHLAVETGFSSQSASLRNNWPMYRFLSRWSKEKRKHLHFGDWRIMRQQNPASFLYRYRESGTGGESSAKQAGRRENGSTSKAQSRT